MYICKNVYVIHLKFKQFQINIITITKVVDIYMWLLSERVGT